MFIDANGLYSQCLSLLLTCPARQSTGLGQNRKRFSRTVTHFGNVSAALECVDSHFSWTAWQLSSWHVKRVIYISSENALHPIHGNSSQKASLMYASDDVRYMSI